MAPEERADAQQEGAVKAPLCDGCGMLAFSPPVNRYDVWAAHCRDAAKSVTGARRVVAVSRVGKPRQIERPVWCRGKENCE